MLGWRSPDQAGSHAPAASRCRPVAASRLRASGLFGEVHQHRLPGADGGLFGEQKLLARSEQIHGDRADGQVSRYDLFGSNAIPKEHGGA